VPWLMLIETAKSDYRIFTGGHFATSAAAKVSEDHLQCMLINRKYKSTTMSQVLGVTVV